MSLRPPGQPRQAFSWFLLIAANALWACSYVAAKFALQDLSVNMMNALRMCIAALVLLPLLVARRKELKLARRDLPQLALLALIFEAFYTIRGKARLVKHPPLLITSAAIVGSVIFWLPVAGWEIASTGWRPLGLTAWLAVGWLALMSTVVGYLAWFQGLANVDGSAAASALFIQPLLGTTLAIVLLHDQLTPMTIAGGILIVIGVSVISRY